ncbi:GGDEF domain-containing protein [Roseospirillum parvum]|uniref:PAS domain S-box-containing protein/diguanylate cyclase (GGDEF) domain-containing protein n=1 Tax=Roseospirillum parvum TaxID=83401 RepID=A0A1G7VZ39_9PROT|nr:GGDEF domain-containing protein [Roseospirillum parvum]SDG64973.1 PAS domain S-box-containing protein/diguanylate cyclase (GGDEF) domain-containing protein [Roseospirillum parvum]
MSHPPLPLADAEAVLANIQDGVVVLSNQRIVYVNPTMAAMVGLTPEDMIGMAMDAMIAPEWRQLVRDRHRRRLAGEEVPDRYPFELVHANGRDRISVILSIGTPIQTDGETRVFGTIKDMSVLQRALDEVAERERDLQNIIDSIPDIFFRTDVNGVVTRVSPSVEAILGYPPAAVLGRPLADFYLDQSDRDRVMRTVKAQGGKVSNLETAMRHRSGRTLWLSTNAFFRRALHGEVIGIEGIARDMTARKTLEDELRRLAVRDPLTGLANRAHLADSLGAAISRARRIDSQLAVLFIDLDGFKQINDQHGHAEGDHLLREVAQRLSRAVRESDHLARIGGDEFVVVVEGVAERAAVQRVGDKIIEAIQAPFSLGGQAIHLGATVGVACFPIHAPDGKALLRLADAAMYRGKRQGRGQVVFFSPTKDL